MTAIELLQQEKQNLIKRLDEINKALNSLLGESVNIKWTERALACIKWRKKFCGSPEILKCLFYKEQNILDDPRIKNNYMAALSMALKNMSEQGILVKKTRIGVKGYLYGLPEWIDEDENIKKEYDVKTLFEMN